MRRIASVLCTGLMLVVFVPRSQWEQWLDRLVLGAVRITSQPSGMGRARGFLRLFLFIERLLQRGHHIRPLRPVGMLSYEVGPLPARALALPDGTHVVHGEQVVILHLSNQSIATIARSVRGAQALTWRMAREGKADLRALAELTRNGSLPPNVRVAWGEGLITQILDRYGFQTRPAAPSVRTPFARLFLLTLLSIYGREGPDQVNTARLHRHLQLGEAWISLETVQERYGGARRAHNLTPSS